MRARMSASVATPFLGPNASQAIDSASRGGPGWRNSKGQCIGWDALPRECGFPPETRCSFEGHKYVHAVPPGSTPEMWNKMRELFHRMRDKIKGSHAAEGQQAPLPK
jgi:hypothetical protein